MAVSFCGDKVSYDELKNFLNIPDKEIYFNFTKYIREGNTKDILIYFNKLNEQGFDLQTFFQGIIGHLGDLMIVKSTGNVDLIDESDSVKGKYVKEAEDFSQEQITRLMKILFEAESRFKYSLNQKILFESILAELCRVNSEVIDLSQILSEIEAIKKKPLTGDHDPESKNEKADSNVRSLSNNIKNDNSANSTQPIPQIEKVQEEIEENVLTIDVTEAEFTENSLPKKENEIITKLKELFDVVEYKVN
jgi:DNA polymerase-3 subunit gamma/tau